MADASTTTTPTDEAQAYEIRPQKVKTLDSKDYDLGWTNQAPTRPVEPPEANPVTLSLDELPDPDEVAAQGIDVQTYMAYFTNVEGAEVVDGRLVTDDSGHPVAAADVPAADDKAYDSWTNDQLRSEIDRRNETRADDQKLPTSGTKADLVAILRNDDGL